eukprot:6861256-Prymnesium_polylepis.1
MRPTGSARFRAGCPHASLGSHRDWRSIAHRPWAPRARTFTTFRAGAGALPSAEPCSSSPGGAWIPGYFRILRKR